METVVIIILAILVILFIATYQGLIIRRYEIKTYKVKEKIRIVMLSDIHESSFGKNNMRLFKKIINLNPDIVCLCGDILDKELIVPSTQMLIKNLAQRYPCFYVIRQS